MKSRRDSWRLSAEPRVAHQATKGFDELVVGEWFHMERMDVNWWWLRLGDRVADIKVDARGEAVVTWRDEE